MPKQTRQLAGSMKWLVARYPQPPGRLIVLGSILTDPENPESSLNRKTGIIPIDKADKLDQTAAVRQQIHSELSNNGAAFLQVVPPDSPLFTGGVKVEKRSNEEAQVTVDAISVKAESFIPDKDYMDVALAEPEIVEYVKDRLWATSLYMIVGVATAGQLTVTEEGSRESLAAASTKASIPNTGLGLGAELSHGGTTKGGSTLKTEMACDFAYRVREFEYSKFSRKFKDKGDRVEGSMFGAGRNGGRDTEEDDVVARFEGWENEDIQVPEMFTLGG
ncbi:hypothetical protein NW767_014624 [Fusarium falciforme]|uniref:Uncharacterized protein n=1 Tax=Fusarium falciforme TaxID=195108 RepID=A0A9W8QUB3_9HYPO|nr:hypothetical protein NW755_014252 [Fusarium falciforme]KAJ4179450.1 hypothetical protein NW767_014624 [Fusarium falciforme]KAJ4184813.1 hypothetical protein NW759_017006 [Fusarium solani]KAJ4232909.1 hypothetical protein NW757_013784 [Fusarium falciforme]